MPPKAGTFEKSWTDAKKKFERDSKVKKPAETVLFWRKGTGIEAALKKVDAAADKAWRSQAGLTAYTKVQDAFARVSAPYYDSVNTGVEDAQKGIGIPKGAVQATYAPALHTLLLTLVDIQNAAPSHQSSATMVVNASTMMSGTVTRGLAFAAKVKTDPKPATFNGGINKAARDITQQIGNIDKLKAQGMDTGFKAPTNLVKILTAWANEGRKVSATATQAEVLRENRAFEQGVLGVKKWLEGGGK